MRNLVIFDLETTGLNINKDHIIQIGAIKVNRETDEVIEKLNEYVRPDGPYTISLGAYMKHRIKPEYLKDKPTLKEIGQKIVDFFKDCDVCTFNGTRFDIPFLCNELENAGYYIDFMNVDCYDAFAEEQRRNANNLESTYKRYARKSMEEAGLTAHDAFSDIQATYEIYKMQNEESHVKPEQMLSLDANIKLMDFLNEEKPCFNIGKYKGVSIEYVSKIDMGYLNWCISDKCGFHKTTKDYIKQFIK